jgi:preprotein translocase subunit SecD
MKQCPYCGLEIVDAATSCEHCGRQLETPSSPAPEPRDRSSHRHSTNQWLKIFALIAGVLVVGCAGIVAVVVIVTRGPGLLHFGPKGTITLVPDTALVQVVDPAKLEQDAQILTERARSMGSSITFRVTGSQIVGQGPASQINEELAKVSVTPGLLELVDFGAQPFDEGAQVETTIDHPSFPASGGKKWHTVLTNADFDMVAVQPASLANLYQIAFTLTPHGTQVLADFTTNNVGHYLGIVVDKRVISSPVIRSAILDGQGVIEGGFTAETAEAMAVTLRVKGPLPVPLKVVAISTPAP